MSGITMRRRPHGLLLLALCGVLGCGSSIDTTRLPTAPVSGTLKLDGQPFGPGVIEFVPSSDGTSATDSSLRMASGQVAADGSFVMGSYESDDGVVPGTYSIRLIGGADDPAMPGVEVAVDDHSVTVTEDGQQELVVELKAKSSKSPGGLMKQQLDSGASTAL